MPKDQEPLINPSDFETIKLKINLINLTTHGEIRDGRRSYGSEMKKNKNSESKNDNLEVLISEFLPDGLMLEIPTKTCAKNHNIVIEVSTLNAKPEVNFVASLRVSELHKLSPHADLVETIFLQKDEQEWVKFQKIFNSRQEEIKKFFNSVRGFEGL